MEFTIVDMRLTPATGFDSGKLRLQVKLSAPCKEDMPRVAKAKLYGLELVEFDPPVPLPMGFNQPTLDTGKEQLTLSVSVTADHPARYPADSEEHRVATVEWQILTELQERLCETWVTGDDVALTLSWAAVTVQPVLPFGGHVHRVVS
jgi:hypothetical protein